MISISTKDQPKHCNVGRAVEGRHESLEISKAMISARIREGKIIMPRLTEQEQQEIVRFIEADRPLPEKYRFLLFGGQAGKAVIRGQHIAETKGYTLLKS